MVYGLPAGFVVLPVGIHICLVTETFLPGLKDCMFLDVATAGFFGGLIDEVMIIDRALNESEIQTVTCGTMDPNHELWENLKTFWRLDSNLSGLTLDNTCHGHLGMLVGGISLEPPGAPSCRLGTPIR